MSEGERARRLPLLWTVAVILLAVLLVRTFAFDVYQIASSSMEPTILEGERVLVLYDRSPPRRYQLVVLSRPGEAEPLVKRAVGLPEESVQIVRGDCLIDGRRLPVEAGRPGAFVVLDEALHDLGPAFNLGTTGLWSRTEEGWEVDGRALDRVDPAGLMFAVSDVTDDYIKDGGIVRGGHEVNDLELRADVWIEGPTGRARFGLNEMGDDLWLELDLGDARVSRHASAALLRTSIGSARTSTGSAAGPRYEPETLLVASVVLDPGRWHRVRFSNTDNLLRAWLDDELVLRMSYEANRFAGTDEFFEGRSPAARLWLGGDGSRCRFRQLSVGRDVYYTGRGRFARDEPEQLGPDEIFVLGDNSAESQDSREWGPVPLSQVLGRPLYVVWPPSRWRRL